MLVVQRSSSRRISNLDALLAELADLTALPPAAATSAVGSQESGSSSSNNPSGKNGSQTRADRRSRAASWRPWWAADHPAHPGGGRGPVAVEVRGARADSFEVACFHDAEKKLDRALS